MSNGYRNGSNRSQDGQKKSFKDFMKGKGVYVFVFACLALAGATALVATGLQGDKQQAQATPAPSEGSQQVEYLPDLNQSIADAEQERNQAVEDLKATPDPTAEPQPTETTKPVNELQLSKPVEGEYGQTYSKDQLRYSKTLDQWTTHQGLDIKADEGTKVCAALAGEVTDVKEDGFYGNVVIIDHGNHVRTVYACLAATNTVKVGDKVEKGQQIGAVGTSAMIESEEGPHLHFEVWKGDASQDPATTFPAK